MASAKIAYAADLKAADRRTALIGVGQRRGLWTYWGQHERHHVFDFHVDGKPTGVEQYLTDDQVDRLPFDYFTDEDNWEKHDQ